MEEIIKNFLWELNNEKYPNYNKKAKELEKLIKKHKTMNYTIEDFKERFKDLKELKEEGELNTDYGKDRLSAFEDLENLILLGVGVELKEKHTPTFEQWIALDIKRMDIYATFLDGFANGNLGNLYREYANELKDSL